MSYLNEEVNCAEPFPSVGFPFNAINRGNFVALLKFA